MGKIKLILLLKSLDCVKDKNISVVWKLISHWVHKTNINILCGFLQITKTCEIVVISDSFFFIQQRKAGKMLWNVLNNQKESSRSSLSWPNLALLVRSTFTDIKNSHLKPKGWNIPQYWNIGVKGVYFIWKSLHTTLVLKFY